MDFDGILKSTGPFGNFQAKIVLLCYLSAFFPPLAVMVDVFANYLPDYRCKVEGCDNEISDYQNDFLNFTTPYVMNKGIWEQCSTYGRIQNGSKAPTHETATVTPCCQADDYDRSYTIKCEDGYVFDRDAISSSSTIEFNLVCHRSYQMVLINSAYMVGMLIGSLTVGIIGDVFGRKVGMFVCVMVVAVGGIGSACSVNMWMLFAFRMFTGTGGNGIFHLAFIIVVEYVIPSHRANVGILMNIPFALGATVVSLLAYWLSNIWRVLLASCTVSFLLLLPVIWLLPESLRWLAAKNRFEDVRKIVENIEKLNKKKCNVKNVNIFFINSDQSVWGSSVDQSMMRRKPDSNDSKTKTVLHLLSFPVMRRRCFINFFLWASVSMSYYGLSENSALISGSVFINFALVSLVEIPAYLATIILLNWLKRRGTLFMSLFTGGFSCIVGGLLMTKYPDAVVWLSMGGKLGTSAAFSVLYLYGSEIFPTEYRSIGLGACSLCACIGGILAPIINSASMTFYEPLAMLVFGSLGLVSSLLTLLLPETAGTTLPVTLQECEHFGRDKSLFHFPGKRKSLHSTEITHF